MTSPVLPADFKVGIFGSRVRGAPSRYSDIDLVILGKTKVPGHVLELVKETAENSALPYRVDVVDLRNVSEDFRKNITKEVVWL